MRSRICAGTILHAREVPLRNQFRYGVYYLLLDVDELDAVSRRVRLFGYDRPNIVSFREADHFGRTGRGAAHAVRSRLRAQGRGTEGGRIMLLTNARVFGYVFNPVSFFFCYGASGTLEAVMAEVHNTQGEEHLYDLALHPEPDGSVSAMSDKAFYVSPFIDMDARYDFRFRIDAATGRYGIEISESRLGQRFFFASLDLETMPLTDGNLGWMLIRYPLVTLQTIGLIHWQALKVWRRGLRYRKNPRRLEVHR